MRETDRLSRRIALWAYGAFLGFAFAWAPSALPLSAGALVIFLFTFFMMRGFARAALAGGACSALGTLLLYFTQHAIDSCAQFNRQPGGSCSMGDSTPFFLVATVFVGAGLVLSYLGIKIKARPDRAVRSV